MTPAPTIIAGLDVGFMIEIFPRMMQALLVTVEISALAPVTTTILRAPA